VLDIPTFDLHPGERVFLAGPSGTGKTSLLSVLSGIAPATEGSARLLGQELVGMSGATRDRLRAEQLGIIFQLFNLVPYLSALENVMLGCQFSAARRAAVAAGGETGLDAARRLLPRLGLPEAVVGQRAAV
jgi:putative ABC transport system ATP-binding protein